MKYRVLSKRDIAASDLWYIIYLAIIPWIDRWHFFGITNNQQYYAVHDNVSSYRSAKPVMGW